MEEWILKEKFKGKMDSEGEVNARMDSKGKV